MRASPAGNALMAIGTRSATQRGVVGRLVAVELSGAQPDPVDDLGHPGLGLVAEHADGQHLVAGQALDDALDRMRRHLTRRGGEDEADGGRPRAPMASMASASLVIPQILTSTVGPLRRRASAEPAPTTAARAGRRAVTSRLAHEHGVEARRGQAARVVSAPDAGLGHGHHAAAGSPDHPLGAAGSTSKVVRSRWFTPTSVAPDGQRPLELALVVHLDQGVEAEAGGQGGEAGELVVVEGGHDEQHGVGPHEPGVADVGLGHGEVLAQHRQGTRTPGRARRSPGRAPK